jgi:hypothetical protein
MAVVDIAKERRVPADLYYEDDGPGVLVAPGVRLTESAATAISQSQCTAPDLRHDRRVGEVNVKPRSDFAESARLKPSWLTGEVHHGRKKKAVDDEMGWPSTARAT